jgi:predicted transcriptional regulator
MPPSQKSLLPLGSRAVILSIKPKYADLILQGLKTVEFRRAWAAQPVGAIVIYASAPVQKLVGTVRVAEVKQLSMTQLWQTSLAHGGGLTQPELKRYYHGKSKGYAVMLQHLKKAKAPLDPKAVLPGFVPPQSFRYLDEKEFLRIESKLTGKKERP